MMLRSSCLWKKRQSPGWVSQTTGWPSLLVIWDRSWFRTIVCWWSNNEMPDLTKDKLCRFFVHKLPTFLTECYDFVQKVQPGPSCWQEHQPSHHSFHVPDIRWCQWQFFDRFDNIRDANLLPNKAARYRLKRFTRKCDALTYSRK